MNPLFSSGIGAFHSILPTKEAVYFSTPITSGPRLIKMVRTNSPTPLEKKDIVRIIAENRLSAEKDAFALRSKFKHVINPTDFDKMIQFPDWTQLMFNDFWLYVLDTFCFKCVAGEGWFLSVGCSAEVARSLAHKVPVETLNGDILERAEAIRLLDTGIIEYQEVGLDCQILSRSRDLLKDL